MGKRVQRVTAYRISRAAGLFWALLLWPPGTTAETYVPIEDTVASVLQGDLLGLSSGLKVRLLGVDSPHVDDRGQAVEFFGREAFQYTQRKVQDRQVRIEFDRQRLDGAGQILGYVYVRPEGSFLNLDIVADGHGHAWLGAPMSEPFSRRFREAEAQARQRQLGLWNQKQREAARRPWQIGRSDSLGNGTRQSPSGQSTTSARGTAPPRRRSRPIVVNVEYEERPILIPSYGGFYLGRKTQLTIRAR